MRETLNDKLGFFSNPYSDDQKLFKNMAIFDLESVFVHGDKLRDTDTTTSIGKHVPISVIDSSNLIEQPIFLCNSNRGALVQSFADALDGLTTQSEKQMNLIFWRLRLL